MTTTPNRPRSRAFTLIELVAVMVVLAVLAAAATIQASSTSATSRLQWASRQVARDLSFARERAMTTGITHWCRFDTSGQYYTILAEDPATPGYASATSVTDPATQASFVTRVDEPAVLDRVRQLGRGQEVRPGLLRRVHPHRLARHGTALPRGRAARKAP